jgi:hypothetical protein
LWRKRERRRRILGLWLGWFVELKSRCVPVGCSRVVNLDVSGVFERERESERKWDQVT